MNLEFLDLSNRDNRKDLEEEEEPHAEPAKAPGEDRQLHGADDIETPGTADVFTGERGDDDYVALEPHSDIDEETQSEKEWQVRSQPLYP